jgi:cyclopropane fatty-acyl-phospholipid synthase-like methyltransferase
VFVDIGCGKGKPLLIAARFPYVVRAMGVELSEALCQAARRTTGARSGCCTTTQSMAMRLSRMGACGK